MLSRLKILTIFLAGAAAATAVIAGLAFAKPGDAPNTVDVKPDSRLQYKWYPPELPKSISFAGEEAPLDRQEVHERLDREVLINYYMHGSMLYILKLSTRYFPVIEDHLKANGVPDDFKYLCVAESSLQHLTSPAGAQSFWQFIGSTGGHYGLQIDAEVDERYNIPKATDAACIYFKEAYAKFGSWTAAAASYNCGQAGYSNQATYQGSNNFYDLIFPEETNRYIFRILALKYLITGANTLGYIIQPKDAYKPYKTRVITITETVPDLAAFAKANGSSYKMLKLLNPWLRAHTLTVGKGKTYLVELPG